MLMLILLVVIVMAPELLKVLKGQHAVTAADQVKFVLNKVFLHLSVLCHAYPVISD